LQIDLDGPFIFVQPGPKEALAISRQRSAPIIQTASYLIESDHVGAELGQGHAAQWRRHERGTLNNAQTG